MPKAIREKAPTLVALGRRLNAATCDHLMGRAVIEQAIHELALGKMAGASYCQNWDRCPGNDWGKCSPSVQGWIEQITKADPRIFTAAELAVIKQLKVGGK